MNFDALFGSELISVVGKGGILILIAIYGIFTLIIFLQIRGLNRLISFGNRILSGIIVTAFLIHLLLVISLFLFALAIL